MTEEWVHLTYEDLAEVLAYDELEKLNEMSIHESIDNICQRQVDSVADAFRGAFLAKGYNIDIRSHYIPQTYKVYVLAMARYFICARFPGSKDIFLDEPRYELFKRAQDLLKDPVLGVPDPDYSNDPELSSSMITAADDHSITVPFQRILPQWRRQGFLHPIIHDYQISCF